MSPKFLFTIGGSITLPVEFMGTAEALRKVLQFNLVLASSDHLSKLTWRTSLTCNFVTLVSVGFYVFSQMKNTNCCLSKKKPHSKCIPEVLTT